jgi:hypothetical protein
MSADEPVRGLDEDCADGLHDYCLTDGCICICHDEPVMQSDSKAGFTEATDG